MLVKKDPLEVRPAHSPFRPHVIFDPNRLWFIPETFTKPAKRLKTAHHSLDIAGAAAVIRLGQRVEVAFFEEIGNNGDGSGIVGGDSRSMGDQCGTSGGDGSGGPDALQLDIESLVVNYHADVYRYAFRLTGAQADAEDITQQAFLTAQQRLHQVRQPERVRGWLYTIVRTCYLKSLRKRLPISATAVELDMEGIPEDVEDSEVDSQLLQAAIDELPEDFKIVLVMFYFEECSYKEIAAQLDISIGTVMSRLARAKGRLRQRLLASGDAPLLSKTTRMAEGAPERDAMSVRPSQ